IDVTSRYLSGKTFPKLKAIVVLLTNHHCLCYLRTPETKLRIQSGRDFLMVVNSSYRRLIWLPVKRCSLGIEQPANISTSTKTSARSAISRKSNQSELSCNTRRKTLIINSHFIRF